MGKYFREAGRHAHYDARFYAGRVAPRAKSAALLALLSAFGAVAAAAGTGPILMHGALIGWAWNRKLLPWDADIDLCLLIDDLRALDRGRETLDYDRERFLFDVNPHSADPTTRNRHPRETLEKNKIDARFIDRSNGLYLDITALRHCEPVDGEPPDVTTKCPHRYRLRDLLPVRQDRLEGVAVQVPNAVEAVLVQEYGERVLTRRVYRGYRYDGERGAWVRGSPLQRFFERSFGAE